MEPELVQKIGAVDGPVTLIIQRSHKKPYPIVFSSLMNAVQCANDARKDDTVIAVDLKANGKTHPCYRKDNL